MGGGGGVACVSTGSGGTGGLSEVLSPSELALDEEGDPAADLMMPAAMSGCICGPEITIF